LAYEAVEHYPDRKLHITNELIAMNVNLVEKSPDNKKNFDSIQEGDVVILPAFGASYEEMEFFDKKVRRVVKMIG
jgi:4-hydroxy-3-methylbut-2-enyl diphosphate reductase